MDTQSQVKVTRLHCEHLRSLMDVIIIKLITIERELATDAHPPSSIISTHLNELEKQSEYIATETIRLQSFLHSLKL
jgi:cob(I)alamin adenosyltransferase